MRRLFIAFDLPNAVYVDLHRIADANLPWRWTDPANMHITLHFLGNVEDETEQSIRAGLSRLEGFSFETQMQCISAFPSIRRARVIAALMDAPPRLIVLHSAIREVLVRAGLDRTERRTYRPHVTLARVKSPDPEAVRVYTENVRLPDVGPMLVDAFSIYQSHLGPAGARYERIASYPLK